MFRLAPSCLLLCMKEILHQEDIACAEVLALTESYQGRITIYDFQNLQYLHLLGWPNYSFNLVMYYAFHVPTTELYDELYGYLKETKNAIARKKIRQLVPE